MKKVFLQHAGHRLYVHGPNSWTGDLERALEFEGAERAVQFAEIWGLREVELVFVGDDPPQVRTVPLEQFGRGPAGREAGASKERSWELGNG